MTDVSPEHGEFDEIVYRISHDLMASVRAIRNLPDWIQEDLDEAGIDLPEEARLSMALLKSHSHRMDRMIEGLLIYCRVGRLQKVGPIETSGAIRRIVETMSIPDRVVLNMQLTPAVMQIGQADFERLIAILVENAVRHNESTAPHLAISSTVEDEWWSLHVADNGPGIPAESREMVFKPMHKLVSRDKDEGSGMGLAIARKIVVHYGGKIDVDENAAAGGGAVFAVALPLGDRIASD
ncbi:sensor histidine kinase [Palleronia sp. LCG004]|uniref:sensor histidine kinase n=1 Tax=Palleronia sp. LCG004 TaxID=3079304 RepID=UPI0029427371|nr:ATP-binding protein [Palleronia sp. LCG004]WOI57925.1 ATP-binding protein [Palleronia sp. LCG004]